MTAEILVMNRSAVAFAAQGGLTAGYGPDPAPTRDSAKIFGLFDGAPVALMIYGRADLLGQPWQSLITHYSETSERPEAKTVQDYANHFMEFIDNNIWMFTEQDQRAHLEGLLAAIYSRVIDEAAELYAFAAEGAPNEFDALNQAIDAWHARYQHTAAGDDVPLLDRFQEWRDESFWERYRKEIEGVLESVFGDVRLSEKAVGKLWDIAFFAATRNRFYEGCTGLVFAGYGQEELMPSMCSYYISSVINFQLKRAVDWKKAITSQPPQSAVVPFAQAEVTNRLMRGIDTGFERDLVRAVEQLVGEVGVHLVNSAPGLQATAKRAVKQELFERLLPDALETFQSWLDNYVPERNISPLLRSLESVGSDDLLRTARALVELNALGRDLPAAGERLDAAVVTRKEGFTWQRIG